MDLKKANVLITGGSEGIGLGLAQRFFKAGSKVLITGRSLDKLERVAKQNPGIQIFKNDIGNAIEREILAEHIKQVMPDLNVLINNAGIQRRVALASDLAPWRERQMEIDILFSGPVHLNTLLIPIILQNHKESSIVNITSGGAYVPQAFAPIYSACKAALHSYTMNLRYSLSETLCKVIEVVPPAVKTNLAGMGAGHGVDLAEFCDTVFDKMNNENSDTIGFGPTAGLSVEINGKPLKEIFETSALRFPVSKYEEY